MQYVGLPWHLWAGDMCISPVQQMQVDSERHEAQQQQQENTSTNVPHY